MRFSEDGDRFEIINPYGKDSIAVCMENAPHTPPYMVCFSYQHRHSDTADEVIAYVNDIISGNVFAIEFFKGGLNFMGSDLDAKEVRDLPQGIPEHFLGQGQIKLFDIADSFRVRGWEKGMDLDGRFIKDEQGNVSIQIADAEIVAHKCCSRNKIALEKSKRCGCFHCLAIFSPEEISD